MQALCSNTTLGYPWKLYHLHRCQHNFLLDIVFPPNSQGFLADKRRKVHTLSSPRFQVGKCDHLRSILNQKCIAFLRHLSVATESQCRIYLSLYKADKVVFFTERSRRNQILRFTQQSIIATSSTIKKGLWFHTKWIFLVSEESLPFALGQLICCWCQQLGQFFSWW